MVRNIQSKYLRTAQLKLENASKKYTAFLSSFKNELNFSSLRKKRDRSYCLPPKLSLNTEVYSVGVKYNWVYFATLSDSEFYKSNILYA